jgi:predicted glycosyltransferase
VVVPEAIPPERLARYGARPPKLRRYPGLKEEYYLADFEPAPVDIPEGKELVVVRAPPEVSLYHRHENPLFRDVLERLGRDEGVHAVALPRTAEQRETIRALGLPSLVVPDRAVDAQSLIAAAAVVVSAGGTMNREAVALGTPVYTTFGGRLGAVDEGLIRDGRLLRLAHATDLDLDRLPPRRERLRRDPEVLLDLLLGERG